MHQSFSIQEIEQAINMPAKEWSGNCHLVAVAIVDSGILGNGAMAAYGHYLGPVAENTLFSNYKAVRHGWIILQDNTIIDPTKWVFEGKEPYLFYGNTEDEHYDRGGDKFRQVIESLNGSSKPEYNKDERQIEIGDDATAFLIEFLLEQTSPRTHISMSEAHWLANRPVSTLGELAEPLYKWLMSKDLSVLIPQDYQEMVILE